jgi:hypothetical protein
MYMVVAGAYRWRDSGLLYEEVVREEACVKTRLHNFGGLVHGFWGFFPTAEFSKEDRKKVEDGLEWLVGRSKEKEVAQNDSGSHPSRVHNFYPFVDSKQVILLPRAHTVFPST